CKLVATMKTMHAFTNAAALTPATRIYRRFMYRWTARKADAIISNSTSQTQDLKRFLNYEESKIKLVYEAIDHQTFRPASSADLKKNKQYLKKLGIHSPFILFVSSLYKYKNAETLIEAFAGIENRKYLLVIVGYPREKAYFERLKNLVSKLNLTEKVIFTGGVSHDETAIFYQSAELFVYPSKYETFGLTVLEAMACGCPVITSNVSSMPEIAGGAAWFFDPLSPAELAFSIRKILGESRLRNELIDKGLKRAKEFTWRKTAEKTLESFRFAYSENHK
ncbi:MAG: glycosyltransferase family 4 protein, partial [bacterium]